MPSRASARGAGGGPAQEALRTRAGASRRRPHSPFFSCGRFHPTRQECRVPFACVLTRVELRSVPPRTPARASLRDSASPREISGRVWSRRVLRFRMLQILATPHKPHRQSAPCGETRSINLGQDLQQCRKPKARVSPEAAGRAAKQALCGVRAHPAAEQPRSLYHLFLMQEFCSLLHLPGFKPY